MRVLCDFHIPYRLVNRLRELGVDATHINRVLDGSGTKDAEIAAFADANRMLLITKDGDFRDSHFLTGTPARVLRLTLGNLSNAELIALVERSWTIIVGACRTQACYLELSRGGVLRVPHSRPGD